jgi:hypothetical protein
MSRMAEADAQNDMWMDDMAWRADEEVPAWEQSGAQEAAWVQDGADSMDMRQMMEEELTVWTGHAYT